MLILNFILCFFIENIDKTKKSYIILLLKYGGVAQLGEHYTGSVGVKGSIPSVSTKEKNHPLLRVVFLFCKSWGANCELEQIAKQDATEQQFGELLRNSPKGACDCEKSPPSPPR